MKKKLKILLQGFAQLSATLFQDTPNWLMQKHKLLKNSTNCNLTVTNKFSFEFVSHFSHHAEKNLIVWKSYILIAVKDYS